MLLKELQHAVRNLSRAPRFSLACVFTLALALAGTATLLNLLEAFVFRRLAVPAPDQLIGIYPPRGEASAGFSAQALQALSDRQQIFTGICGVTAGYGTLGVQFDSGAVRQRPYEAVTGNCYELLGVTPSMGRLITPEDGPIAGDPGQVVLISDRVWRQEFGSSPDVLGRTVRVEGTPLTVVGVLPATYRGLNADEAPDIALPITLPWKLRLLPPLAMHAVGRLRPGTGIGEAAAHLSAIWPVVRVSTMNNEVERFLMQERLITSTSLVFAALAAVVSVAGLYATLSQNIIRRRREIGIRIAVGATPNMVRTLVLKDACWILLVGLGLGIPVALAGERAARSLLSDVSTRQSVPSVYAATAGPSN